MLFAKIKVHMAAINSHIDYAASSWANIALCKKKKEGKSTRLALRPIHAYLTVA